MEKVLFSLAWFSFCLTYSYRHYFHRGQKGKSVCDFCYKELKWWMKLPMLGYLLNQGKCSYCKQAIPLFWFGIDVYSLLVGLAWQNSEMPILPFMSLSFLFIKMGLEDAYSEKIQSIDLWLSASLMAFFYYRGLEGKWLIAVVCILISPYLRNQWMGEGDICLCGIFLFGLPWELFHLWLGLASGFGLLFAISTKKRRIPFGPWLLLVGWLLLILTYQ
ncbi:prepilin peptidase [Bulleidia sp. zg-1006]|uniref:prepilin peptidase n=1 Tax=Bulleidia sp. zg-1006 TaxID=2806552 RepID=UPI001939B838|nr:prepilin peptidase [Bulleidia sp. zg-1006]QRG86575.1 prepilin peptidase [Bulleidia sp. zg-1006]